MPSIVLCAMSLVVAAQPTIAADTLAGRVRDKAGCPIARATVHLPQLGRATSTDAAGRFVLGSVPDGRWTLSISAIGYAPAYRQLPVSGRTTLDVVLEPSPVELPTIVVTATSEPRDRLGTALASGSLETDQLRRSQSVAIARAVEQLPGVRSVTTGSQIAKPMIRGLSGQRVLVLDGGHRLEDYSWSDEDGPSLDARLAGRVEVVRGPASLLYGADALGGVINAIPDALPESAPSGSPWHRTTLELSAASNNAETGTTFRYERGAAHTGFRATVVGRRAASLRTPRGELDNTGFFALNGEAAYGIHSDRGSLTLRVAHYGGEFRLLEANGPTPAIRANPAPTEKGPVRKARDERLQLDALRVVGPWRLEGKAQFQQHSLVEVSDEANPSPGAGKERVAFDLLLNTLTLGATAQRAFGQQLHTTFGVSGLRQTNATRGPIPLVPAGTTTDGAAFAVVEHRFAAWSILGGVRADLRSLEAGANSALAFAGDSRDYHAITGNLGVVYRVADGWSIGANVGRAWRAPNLFELFTNGPKLSEARYEIGSPSLATEVGLSGEASIRWQHPKFRGEITAYRQRIDNYIFVAPTGRTNAGLPVYLYRQTDAQLTGGELTLEVDLLESFTIRARVDGLRALDRSGDVPLPLTPPLRTVVGAEWHDRSFGWAGRAHLSAELVGVSRQQRLAPVDLATAGYSLLELSAGFDRAILGRSLAMELTVHNAANTAYRDFLSRYKAFALNPGRDVVLRVALGL